MTSYFGEQLAELRSRGLRNSVSDVRLEKGDLAQSWSEGSREYATVAMQFSMLDATRDGQGRVVDGSPTERPGRHGGLDVRPQPGRPVDPVGHPASPLTASLRVGLPVRRGMGEGRQGHARRFPGQQAREAADLHPEPPGVAELRHQA